MVIFQFPNQFSFSKHYLLILKMIFVLDHLFRWATFGSIINSIIINSIYFSIKFIHKEYAKFLSALTQVALKGVKKSARIFIWVQNLIGNTEIPQPSEF